MGATEWRHRVPYEMDPDAALDRLRLAVYRRGDYQAGYDGHQPTEVDDARARQAIDELLEELAETGTHSILDIDQGLSTEPGLGTMAPLSPTQTRRIFGTDHPTDTMIEAWLDTGALDEVRARWCGLLITGYEADQPVSLWFTGFSGD